MALVKRLASGMSQQAELPPVDLRSSALADRHGASRLPGDVAENRRPLQPPVEAEARFRELISAIREVFWILDASTGHILYVSPAYEEL